MAAPTKGPLCLFRPVQHVGDQFLLPPVLILDSAQWFLHEKKTAREIVELGIFESLSLISTHQAI